MKSKPINSQLKHSLKTALVFQIGWVVAGIIGILAGVPVSVGLLIVLLLVALAPALIEVITRTKLPTAIHIHFLIFVTLSSVAGSIFGMYARIPHWDTFLHMDSGVLLAWLGFFLVQNVEQGLKVGIPKWFAISVAFAVPMTFAALWEISEFLSDMFLHTTTQAGLEDTIVDMFVAAIGALIAVLLASWWSTPKSVLPRSFSR